MNPCFAVLFPGNSISVASGQQPMRVVRSLLPLIFVAFSLAACGGGGGGSGSESGGGGGGGSPLVSTLSGVAAVGTPIVNGIVNVICASGGSLTTTTGSTNGIWQVNLTDQSFPCAVEVSGGTINGVTNTTPYHSIASTSGTVNITPLTDLIVANLVGSATPSTWFAGLSSNPISLSTITQARINASFGNMVSALYGLTPLSENNPITTPFTPTPGNVIDNMLSALSTAAANNNVTYSVLLSYAASPTFSIPVTGFNASLTTAYSDILLATTPPLSPGYYILNNANVIGPSITNTYENALLLVQVAADSSITDLTDSAIWSSSNPSVVTVSNSPGSKGNLAWHATGNVVISAQVPGVTATTNIVSTSNADQLVAITRPQQVAPPGSHIPLYSSFCSRAAACAVVTSFARWTSLDPSIAEVSQPGVVHVKSPGIVRIISEYNGLVGSSIIYVPDVKMLDEDTPIVQTSLLGSPSIIADSQNRAFAWWTRGNNSIVYATRTAQGTWSGATSLALPFGTLSSFIVTSNREGALLVMSPQNTQATDNPLMYSIGSTTTGLGNFQLAATLPGFISNLEAGIDQAGNGFAVYTTPQGAYSQHYDAATGVWGQPMLISGVTTGITEAFSTCPNGDGHLLWINGGGSPPYSAYISTYHADTSSWDTPLQINNLAEYFYSTGDIVCNSKSEAVAVLDGRVTTNGITARSVMEIGYVPGAGWGQVMNLFPGISPDSLPSPWKKSYLALTDTGLIGVSCDDALMLQMWVAIFDPLSGWSSTSQFSTAYLASSPEIALFSPRPNGIAVAYLGPVGPGFTEDFLLRTYTSGTGWGPEIGNSGYSYFGYPNASFKFAVGSDGNAIVVWQGSTSFPLPNSLRFGSYLLATNLVFP